MRDNLSINTEDGSSFVGDTPREQRVHMNSVKRSLKAGFMNLPRPENNFELLVPEDEDEEAAAGQTLSEEDAAERDARLERIRKEEEQKALARRSQAIQLGLPRPPNVDLQAVVEDLRAVPAVESELEKAQRLVDLEVAQLQSNWLKMTKCSASSKEKLKIACCHLFPHSPIYRNIFA